MVFGDPLIPVAVTVTVAVRPAPVAFAVAVIVKLPGVFPLAGATDSQSTLSLTVQPNDVLLPQFVTATDGLVPPDSGAAQALDDTHNAAGFNAWVTAIFFGDPLIPVAVTVTVAVRPAPVVFAVAVIVKLPGVFPLAGATVNQSTLSLTVQLNDASFPQFVTVTDGLVPPVSGAAQALSDTQSADPVESCRTTTVSGEPAIPMAETTISAMREVSVLLLSAITVKLSGVVPAVSDRLSQSTVSVAIQAKEELLFPQFVTLIEELVPPVSGAAHSVSETH